MILAAYDVGKYKPPISGQIKKGERRNPRGRPKKPKVGERTLDDFLNEKVSIERDGRKVMMTKRELMLAQIANKAAKGDERASRLVLAYDAARHAKGPERDPFAFDPEFEKILLADLKEEFAAAAHVRPTAKGGANGG